MTCLYADSMGDHYTAAQGASIYPWSVQWDSRQPGRIQGYCMRIASGTTPEATLWDGTQAEAVAHFAFRFNALTTAGNIFEVREGSNTHSLLYYNGNDTFSFKDAGGTVRGTSSPLGLVAGVWYHIQFRVKISDTVGELELRMTYPNGSPVTIISTVGSLDTKNGGSGFWVKTRFTAGFTYMEVDDYHVWSGATFKGDTQVKGQVVSGAGNYHAWTPLASTNISQVKDPTEDGDTTYNSGVNTGDRDSFTLPALAAGAGAVVSAVIARVIARQESAGSRQVNVFTRSGGTDYDGTDQSLTTSYAERRRLMETDPRTSAAWTQGGVDDAEIGYKAA